MIDSYLFGKNVREFVLPAFIERCAGGDLTLFDLKKFPDFPNVLWHNLNFSLEISVTITSDSIDIKKTQKEITNLINENPIKIENMSLISPLMLSVKTSFYDKNNYSTEFIRNCWYVTYKNCLFSKIYSDTPDYAILENCIEVQNG